MTDAQNNTQAQTLVRLTRDAMIVSFQNAHSPSVWRVKRTALEEATFKVVENGSLYDLVFMPDMSSKGEVVSQYDKRADATAAMNAIMDVVIQMDGGEEAVVTTNATPPAAPAPAAKIVANTTPKEMENDQAMTQVSNPTPRKRIWMLVYWIAFAFLFLFFLASIFFGVQSANEGAVIGSEDGGMVNMLPDQPNRDTMGGDVNDMPEAEEGRPLSADEYFGNSLNGE